jgi:hypothetical protein
MDSREFAITCKGSNRLDTDPCIYDHLYDDMYIYDDTLLLC